MQLRKLRRLRSRTGAALRLENHSFNITGTAGMIMNTIPVTLRVISPSSVDLSLTKSASPNPGQVGVSLSYRITVTNNGPAVATNVSVTDTLPSGVNFVSATTTQGYCSGTASVNCNLGSLAVGSSAVITIVVTPSAPVDHEYSSRSAPARPTLTQATTPQR